MRDNFYSMDASGQQTATQEQKPHVLSSNIRQPKASISVFHRKKSPKLQLDRYLQGRSYQLFKRGVKAPKTLQYYNRHLYGFCEFMGMTTEEIVDKYGPFIKVKGKSRPNVEGQIELQQKVENYVLMLQDRVEAGEIKATTCMPILAPVRLFCEMNDIHQLGWKKISRLLPKSDLVATDAAYTHEQLKKMLGFCDLRARVILLFIASSGVRLGGLVGLKDGDVTPIYSESDPSRVIAAHLVVYQGTEDQYDTFVTEEAWQAYAEYREMRIKYGEKLTKDSPVILSRFSPSSMAAGKVKAIDDGTVTNIISAVCYKAGITEQSKYYKNRFHIKRVHGLRKFFLTSLKSVKTSDGKPAIEFLNRERLMGHALMNQHSLEDNYDRSDLVKVLFEEYRKAMHVLTISEEARLALKVTNLQAENQNLRTIEVELSAKDREIRELRANMEAMQETHEELKELLKHPEKILELMTAKEDY